MLFAAGGSVDFRAPVPRYLNGHVPGCAKAVQREAPAFFDTRNSQAAEADDSGTEKWSGLFIVKVFWNLIYKLFPRHGVLRISAIDGVPGELRMVAKIFHSGAAVFARLIRAVKPGNSHPRASAKTPGLFATFLDDANHLVPRDHRRFSRWQFAFDYVQISATDAAKMHADQHFALSRLRHGNVGKFQRVRFNPRCGPQYARFHSWVLRFLIPHLRRHSMR